jgi:SAM-dependent methyltransferase
MRIVTIMDTREDAQAVEVCVSETLKACDVLIAISHRSAARTRETLVRLMRQGLPIVIVDDPAPGACDPARFDLVCRNTHRLFRPDALILLHGAECVVSRSRQELERALSASRHLVGCRLARYAAGGATGRADRHLSFERAQHHSPVGWVRRRLWSAADLEALDESYGDVADSADATGAAETLLDAVAVITVDARGESHTVVFVPPADQPLPGLVGDTSPVTDEAFWSRQAIDHSERDAKADADSGVLGPAFHTAQFYLDLSPFRYVAEKYRPASVLDIGCGLGGYLVAFRRWGAGEVQGVDGFANGVEVLCPDAYVAHDLRRRLDLERTFDLVLCTEVVEHIPAEYGLQLLDTIHRHARGLILFSAAAPSQPGVGHVNCRPVEYWLDGWRQLGWEPNVFESIAVRSLGTYHWFRRNLIVLQRRGRSTPMFSGFALEDLSSYEARMVHWVAQSPGIHVYPFEEPLAPIHASDAPSPNVHANSGERR